MTATNKKLEDANSVGKHKNTKLKTFNFKIHCPTKKMTEIRQFGTTAPAGENCPFCFKSRGVEEGQCNFTLRLVT